MKKEGSKKIREGVLADCKPEEVFWICNGTIIKNINELGNTIESLDKWAFTYHINDDNKKNDFAIWINDVLGDKKLARELKKVTDQKKYVKVIRKRIKELEG